MLFTLFGITVFLHPAINVLGFVSMMALQLFLLSYWGLFFSTIIEESAMQFAKALSLMLVTLLGIVMEVKLSHA